MIGMCSLYHRDDRPKKPAAVRTFHQLFERAFEMLNRFDAVRPGDFVTSGRKSRRFIKIQVFAVLTRVAGKLLNGPFCGGTGGRFCGTARHLQVAERLFSRMKEMNR
jgi:hypothetical protein